MINGKKMIGIIGAESTGKSTLGLMLTGRLRTHGIHAALVAEAGSARPFTPALLDTTPAAHVFSVTHKLAQEAAATLRPNVDVIVSDRTPFDLFAYYAVRFVEFDQPALRQVCLDWLSQYDQIYYLPTAGAEYVEDGYRQAQELNDYRERVDRYIADHLTRLTAFGLPDRVVTVEGTHRQRAEWVYHHTLWKLTGATRPLRVYRQLECWFTFAGFPVVEIRPQGSNSVTRFHPSTDHDDVDALVIIDGGPEEALRLRAYIDQNRVALENLCQCNLDLLVTPKGLEVHET